MSGPAPDHTLWCLQARGLFVTAIDALPGAVRVMDLRGVIDARAGDCFSLPSGHWDTLLYLMNGTMPFGTLAGLGEGLTHARTRVSPNGRLLLDSTDLRGSSRTREREDGRYVGEAQYQFEYDGERGQLIPQLFGRPRAVGRSRRAGGLGNGVDLVRRGRALPLGAHTPRCLNGTHCSSGGRPLITRPGRMASSPNLSFRSSMMWLKVRSRTCSCSSSFANKPS